MAVAIDEKDKAADRPRPRSGRSREFRRGALVTGCAPPLYGGDIGLLQQHYPTAAYRPNRFIFDSYQRLAHKRQQLFFYE